MDSAGGTSSILHKAPNLPKQMLSTTQSPDSGARRAASSGRCSFLCRWDEMARGAAGAFPTTVPSGTGIAGLFMLRYLSKLRTY